MQKVLALYSRFSKDESGATMVEYAIMIALIASVCIVIIRVVGEKTNNSFGNVNNAL